MLPSETIEMQSGESDDRTLLLDEHNGSTNSLVRVHMPPMFDWIGKKGKRQLDGG